MVDVVRSVVSGKLKALKTFDCRLLWSDDDRARFEREALTWVSLDPHPNIATALGLEVIEGRSPTTRRAVIWPGRWLLGP